MESLACNVEEARHSALAALALAGPVLPGAAAVLAEETFQDGAEPLVLLSTPVLVVEVCGVSSVVVARL